MLGSADGQAVGTRVGEAVGGLVGAVVGGAVGPTDGDAVGVVVGGNDGLAVGAQVGGQDGAILGNSVGDQDIVGEVVGDSVGTGPTRVTVGVILTGIVLEVVHPATTTKEAVPEEGAVNVPGASDTSTTTSTISNDGSSSDLDTILGSGWIESDTQCLSIDITIAIIQWYAIPGYYNSTSRGTNCWSTHNIASYR
jgi:hypothetical protein